MNTLKLHGISPTIAIVTIVALLVWAAGFPMWINNAQAAMITNVSDTLSDSDVSVVANHTISFVTPTGVSADDSTITLTFPGGFGMGSLAFGDIDVATTSDYSIAANCAGADAIGASVAGQVVTLQMCNGDSGGIPAGATTTIEIGTNATFGASGVNQITNPTAGSHKISIGGTMTDSGATRVYIIDDVVVTAAVDTSFTFVIAPLGSGIDVNGVNTTVASATTSLAFGTLTVDTPAVMGQELRVSTNAANGFTVTVEQDQNLTSGAGDDIDLFVDGTATSTPIAWQSPDGTLAFGENGWGHLGFTSEDSSLSSGDEFGSALFAGNLGSAREVFYNTGPADGTTANQGLTQVAYQIEVSALQEAGNDYTNTLTYIATPTF